MAAAASAERLPPLLLVLRPSALRVAVPLRVLVVLLLRSQPPSGAALPASQPGHVARLLREGEGACWAAGVACEAACLTACAGLGGSLDEALLLQRDRPGGPDEHARLDGVFARDTNGRLDKPGLAAGAGAGAAG